MSLSILVLKIHHDLKYVLICTGANRKLGKSANIERKRLVRTHCYFFYLLIHIVASYIIIQNISYQ